MLGYWILYWILDTIYWILDTLYWILDTGYFILDTGYFILRLGEPLGASWVNPAGPPVVPAL